MALEAGTKLGSYEIISPLGAGGMGEVYRARDTKLGREVAIKVLPEEFTEHSEKLARFEREARLLAALNHPKIATLYGVEEFEAKPFLVMELVEGETLADRIARGPLPVEEALAVAHQIAEALEAAHEKGVIHRDLKPANIKVDAEGNVKVLDFGLAKAFAGDEASENELSQSPTLSRDATRAGVILGTAAYMSPEQAKGKAVDKRTDIFSFGIVLYEMLTGKKAFRGEDVPEVLASIIGKETDWSALPKGLDARLEAILGRCLRKDRKLRRRDIGDVRVEIQEILAQPRVVSEPAKGRTPVLAWAGAFLAGVVLAGITAWYVLDSESSSPEVARLVVSLPFDQVLAPSGNVPFAISKDGKRIAYVTDQGALYVRDIDSFEPRLLTRARGARDPFFSPDGEWIAYRTSDGLLEKVPFSGGAPRVLCDVSGGPTLSGSWGPDGTIVFDQGIRFLWRVSSDGGSAEPIAEADRSQGELLYLWPQILPDGDTVLFTVTKGETGHAALLSLETGEQRIVLEDSRGAVYVPTGHLVYGRGEQLYAVPFDVERGMLLGEPTQVGAMVSTANTGAAQFQVSPAGVLAYWQGGANLGLNQIVWVDREGGVTPLSDDEARYEYPHVSPDGKYLAVALHTALGGHDVWIYDIERRSRTRLTFGEQSTTPFWTADGTAISFETTREGGPKIYRKLADGSGEAERLPIDVPDPLSGTWSPDGSGYVFGARESGSGDIWWWPENGEPHAIISSPYYERSPRISPDGQWLAYTSDESGQREVYVRPFPDLGAKYLVSRDGGSAPVWSRDGTEIFYRRGDQMIAVSVTTEPSFRAGIPEVLFEGRYELRYPGHPGFDVSADGQRFVMIRTNEETAQPNQINIVLNWFDELERLVPAE